MGRPPRLPQIESEDDLFAFLREDLNWPLPDGAIADELTFDWTDGDLRLPQMDAERLPGGTVRQLRPLVPGQPWGIFLVEFIEETVYRTALRQILRGLVPGRRRNASLKAWQHDNLLFICATAGYESLTFAHFRGDHFHRARLATFGWRRGSTYLRTLLEHNLPYLAWPSDDGASHADWLKTWAKAFDKEPVTKKFFDDFNAVFGRVRDDIALRHPRWPPDIVEREAQTLLNRLLFLYFIQRKGWLNRQRDYLVRHFREHVETDPKSCTYLDNFLKPLFVKLSTSGSHANIPDHDLPFLNGGLFADEYGAEHRDHYVRRHHDLKVGNDTFQHVFADLLQAYNFTVREDTPLDLDVAIDPEMLGKIFESLVLQLENSDTGGKSSRHNTGSYYTPRPIVHYLCRNALKAWLTYQAPFVDQPSASREKKLDLLLNLDASAGLAESGRAELDTLLSPDEARILAESLSEIRACDPAVGSGAFPVVLLHELLNVARLCEIRARGKDPLTADPAWIFETKTRFIERVLYGVDIQPRAIEICKLRLWLSLVVDYPLDVEVDSCERRSFQTALKKLPALPNLEFKIRSANALADHIHGQRFLLKNLAGEDRARLPLNRLVTAKRDYYSASAVPEKRRLRFTIYEALSELADIELTRARNEYGLLPSEENADRAAELERARKELGIVRVEIQAARKMKTVQQDEALERIRAFFEDEKKPTFVWQLDFAEVFHRERNPRFDIIIGNPPFIRIHVLHQENPDFAAWLKENYTSAGTGNFDLYVVFVQRSLDLLQSHGQLAFVLPHKFFNNKYGQPLRELIGRADEGQSSGRGKRLSHLRHVVHFGDQQIFPGVTNYVCLLFLSRAGTETCRWLRADDLPAWMETQSGDEGIIPAAQISGAEWNFVVGPGAKWFNMLQAWQTKLGAVADIFVGLQTSADRVYAFGATVQPKKGLIAVRDDGGNLWHLEQGVMKRFLHDVPLTSYAQPDANSWLLFPYTIRDGRAELIPRSEFASKFPEAWRYLATKADQLRGRDGGKWHNDQWYAFGRSQNLTQMEAPKLIVQVLSQSGRYAFDAEEIYFTGGGNGPYYGVRWASANEPRSLHFLQALLNSRVHDFYIRKISGTFQGGYWSYGKQFIEQLPIPPLDLTRGQERLRHDAFVRLVEWLLWLKRQPSVREACSTAPRDPLIAAYFEQWINALAYELFFPAELAAAGIQLFDMFSDCNLSPIGSLTPNTTERMAFARQEFARLSASGHRLRIALDNVQTLDLVRTIEARK